MSCDRLRLLWCLCFDLFARVDCACRCSWLACLLLPDLCASRITSGVGRLSLLPSLLHRLSSRSGFESLGVDGNCLRAGIISSINLRHIMISEVRVCNGRAGMRKMDGRCMVGRFWRFGWGRQTRRRTVGAPCLTFANSFIRHRQRTPSTTSGAPGCCYKSRAYSQNNGRTSFKRGYVASVAVRVRARVGTRSQLVVMQSCDSFS